MAFDGPSPFQGDPAYLYLDEIVGQSPEVVRATITRALELEGTTYVEVDEGVWAWCAAEMLAIAIGRPPAEDVPEPFANIARMIPDCVALVPAAIAALAVVADPGRSEVAGLWQDRGVGTLADHLAPLRRRLAVGRA
jgi:hypothetical protein